MERNFSHDDDADELAPLKVYHTRASGVANTPKKINKQECIDYIRAINIKKPQKKVDDLSWKWLIGVI